MDDILQIFKRSISTNTLFFESLTKKPLALMDNLFRWANKYAMLEDDVLAVLSRFWLRTGQQKIIRLEAQSPRTISSDKRDESRTNGNSSPSNSPHWPSLMSSSFRCFKSYLNLDDQSWSRLIWPSETGSDNASTIRTMDIPRSSAKIYTT